MSKRILSEAKWNVETMIKSLDRLSLPQGTSQDIYDHIDAAKTELGFLASDLSDAANEAEETTIEDLFWHYWD
jgi:hypothetical protein